MMSRQCNPIHSVIFISRNPNIQVYEGLCEIVRTCTELPANVFLVCPQVDDEDFRELMSCGLKIHKISPGGLWSGMPTSMNLLAAALRLHRRHRARLFAGCDMMGNVVAAIASKLTSTAYLHYSLELPSKRQRSMSLQHKLEHWSYRRADLVVTMDEPHADFICSQTRALRERIGLAPVSVRGPGRCCPSDTLKERLGLSPDAVLILHAGGIGAAQASIQLAEAARSWRPEWHLVFHAHCNMSNEPYFQEFSHMIEDNQGIHLNAESVPQGMLDELVSNADIGLAWYDRELLGYRADLLGLAAGKIGRCLRNGIPVIVRDLPTIRAYIDKYRCGLCVSRAEDIGAAIGTIMRDRKKFSQNALCCYEELWRPDRYLDEIRERIRLLSAT